MNPIKLALAMIVKGSDDEAESLAQCLVYTASHVDGIFITITHRPGEERNKKVEEVCNAYGAVISDFEWVNDFSAARNFNFRQVSKEFTHILWLDADDAVRGMPMLKRTIAECPDEDAFALSYLYAFDEWQNPVVVHIKTQVVRNDDSVEWVGALHEDLRPRRDIKPPKYIQGIERIHLSKPERFESAKARNLEVAQSQLAKEPEDPRSFWNVANAYKALGREEEAIKAFDEFLKTSNSDDEKYIARLRRAESFWIVGKKPLAIEEARYAIGTKPEYPDAYHLLGSLYLETRQFERARDMYQMGLTRKPPYYKIIVYNPRDYDYTPLLNLAKVYFNLSLPTLAMECLKACKKIYPKDTQLRKLIRLMKKECDKFEKVTKQVVRLSKITDKEKLRKALDKLPVDVRAHPGIVNLRNVNFIKETSSGRDLVYFCGFTEEEWTPETAKTKGIGGSEEAVIWLSNLFADAGWNVTVYNNCGNKEQVFGKVTYRPYWMWNYRDRQDATIIWRTPKYCEYEINSAKVFVDMHDVIPAEEFTEERLKRTDKIFVKSQFQRNLFKHIPDEKFVIVPNGIDPSIFEENVERDLKLVVNTSAPNRGISQLTEIWRRVKEAVPDAKLMWAYGWGTFDSGFGDNAKVMEWKDALRKKMKEYGVVELGRLSHSQVAQLYLSANVWAYPCGFGEIDCISLSKAMAAGAIPVTTDFAALGEKAGHGGYFVHSDLTSDTWAKPYQFDFALADEEQVSQITRCIIEALQKPPPEEEREAMRNWARQTFAWNKVAARWLQELCA